MKYEVDILLSAKIQIDEALDYYSDINNILPGKFLEKLDFTYECLQLNPYFQKRYRNVRAIPVIGFPYLLLFTIEENKKVVKIISCFHTSQNPEKYPESN